MKNIGVYRKLLTSITIISLMFMFGCSSAPKIEEVENSTKENAEALFTEDNNEDLTLRMDRYFLNEKVDDLTYKGALKGTAFYKSLKWDDKQSKIIQVPDSEKVYLHVTVKYFDKKYDKYTILIQDSD